MQVFLTNTAIARAQKDSERGAAPYDLFDGKTPGLLLRVQPTGLRWHLRFRAKGKRKRLDFGDVKEWSVAEARDLAVDAHRMVRNREDVPTPEWVRLRKVRLGKLPNGPASFAPGIAFKWTFAEAREHFLAEVERTRRPDTLRDYAYVLSRPEFGPLTQVPVGAITREQLAEIIARVHETGIERFAEKMAATLRSVWTYLAMDRVRNSSGVRENILVGLAAPEASRQRRVRQGYVPPIAEVGRILAIARSGALPEQIGTAVELLLMTVQRRHQVVTAGIRDLDTWLQRGGVWRIPHPFRKTADRRGDWSSHIVPVVQPTWRRLLAQRNSLVISQEAGWLFPQFRPRRRGGPMRHMNGSVLSHAFLQMPGVLASPHDIRRAFTRHMRERRGYDLGAIKAILDHNEGHSSNDVTRVFYDSYDGRNEKLPLMQQWASDLEAAAKEEVLKDRLLTDVAWLANAMQEARHPKRSREEFMAGRTAARRVAQYTG